MKKLILLLLIMTSTQTFSQSTPKGLTDSEFAQLKKDYGAMTKSESYKAMRASTKELAHMVGKAFKDVKNANDWNKWISTNLASTKFKTIEEANAAWKTAMDLTTKHANEFADVYARMGNASHEQTLDIVRTEMAGGFD